MITLGAGGCHEAVKGSLPRYGRPEILNADHGSQLTGSDALPSGALSAAALSRATVTKLQLTRLVRHMVFASLTFLLLFLPGIVLLHVAVAPRFRNLVLLVASTMFYAWGAPRFVLVVLVTAVFDFLIAHRIAAHDASLSKKRLWLTAGIVVNLGLLAYAKYANFFVQQVNGILTAVDTPGISWVPVVLPLGISFFTFQKVSYLVDVARRQIAPAEHLGEYLLYILLFPQLIAGPILRFGDIAPQVQHRSLSVTDVFAGMLRLSVGLGKKVLIADVLAVPVDEVFSTSPDQLRLADAWFGAGGFMLQLYFDFSGYSDMAIGIARMFGFRLRENFRSPLLSTSIADFWARWHISLGTMLRDYVLLPLTRRPGGRERLRIIVLFTFVLSGLWHGAGWTFIAFGAIHGCFVLAERSRIVPRATGAWRVVTAWYVPLVLIITIVLFRADSMSHASAIYASMVGLGGSPAAGVWEPLLLADYWRVVACSVGFIILPSRFVGVGSWYRVPDDRQLPASAVVARGGVAVGIIAVSLSALAAGTFRPFLYFQF